jgi:hypothetical protein
MRDSMLIEFKKLLGLQYVPWEFLILSIQLASHEFQVNLKGVTYTIRMGSFGTTREELVILAGGVHSDEREYFIQSGQARPTLDIVFEWDPVYYPSDSKLEGNLKALRPQAHAALNCFLRTWMQTEKNRLSAISEDEMFAIIRRIPRISLSEFQTDLFYRAHTPTGLVFNWLGEGVTTMCTVIPDTVKKEIDLNAQSGLNQVDEQLLNAWLNYYDENFSASLLNAAFACEILTKNFLSNRLNHNGIGPERTEQFVRWLPMPEMFTVVLPSYFKQIRDRSLLGNCVKIVKDRNDIAHGKKAHVSRDEASYALSRSEELVKLLR